MWWLSLFLSLSRSWGTVSETGADHNWHLHCSSSSWHHVCGGLLQNQVNFSLLFCVCGCWSGPSQLTVTSLGIKLYLGFSRGELKRQTCDQGALVQARWMWVSMSTGDTVKLREVSERFSVFKCTLKFFVFFVCFLFYHSFQLVSPVEKEQTPTLELHCFPAVNFMYKPNLFVLETQLMMVKVTIHQRPKKWTQKHSQCKSGHLNVFCESLNYRGWLSNMHEALWTINYTEHQQNFCCQNFWLPL